MTSTTITRVRLPHALPARSIFPASSLPPDPASSASFSSPQSSFLTSASTEQVYSIPALSTSISSPALPRSTTSSALSVAISTSLTPSATSNPSNLLINSAPICLGKGLDSSSVGLLASLAVTSLIGFVIWLVFAIVRPRFRQIYSLREWFVSPELRPKPSGSGFFSFLSPPVPLVPALPQDVSGAGRSASKDAELFPSDEQIHQRILWTCFTIASWWSILALVGALPLYLVTTPCLAQTGTPFVYEGVFSTLEDLSVMRLLRLFDPQNITTTNLLARDAGSSPGGPHNARVRIIVLTILTLGLGFLPALCKIIREFSLLVAYRRRFVDVRCEGIEMGWLSASSAPGFVSWGEKRIKDFILKNGLSLSMDERDRDSRGRRSNRPKRTRRPEEQPLNYSEEANIEVDIHSLFSISDTQALAHLIDERDEVLEHLEIAEARYIRSFRITTPDPSIADYEPPPPADPSRPYISRPLPLGPPARRGRRRRAANPAYATSSLAPTSFVAPSQYYKLRGVRGVSGGRFTDSGMEEQPSLTESINSRVIGSRFLEVTRNSVAYGRLPLGSHVIVDKSGQLGPGSRPESMRYSTFPDPRFYGPNYIPEESEAAIENAHQHAAVPDEDEWIDLAKVNPDEFETEVNGVPSNAGPSTAIRRHKKDVTAATRESFPLRKEKQDPDSVPPPHLRLQPSQPFVRPLDGLNYDDLGQVYADITQWRSKLKAVNAEIADAQKECYNDIADGARIKGWLMVGRGLKYVPGVQLIEGRAKEDIRWDVLQNERNIFDTLVLWAITLVIALLLAVGLAAAAGLAVATAPDVAHYLPFFQSLLKSHPLATGIATVLASAVAATLFMVAALLVVHWAVHVHGSISVSGGHMFVFKITFYILTLVGAIWLVAAGALLFSLRAFSFNAGVTKSLANGSIYLTVSILAIVLNVAIIFPGLLLLQPFRLWHILRTERHVITPRQRFRLLYPRTYDPSFATGPCILAMTFASAFVFVFPIIGPAVTLLLFLVLIAHRYLIGYVYARTHSQTGGLLQLWVLKRFGSIISLQPIFLGLVFLSRRFWIEGGILAGAGVVAVIFVELYTGLMTRSPGRRSLSAITQNSLNTFEVTAWTPGRSNIDEGTDYGSSSRGTRPRGSMASVLEMMSLTLAVMPSPSAHRGPVPLRTETLDDLTATERAARTHPDAPPHLPPLPFTDHAEDMAGILYAPELVAPPPIIWLPNDHAGVSRSEAVDLQKYHNLEVTIDVRSTEDIVDPQLHRTSSSRTRASR